MDFTPTEEQEAIRAAFATGEDVAVQALAGSGKTASTQLVARDYPKRQMTYCAFNKALADDAKGKFGRHVSVSTVHSFAYRALGVDYKDRLNGERIPAWKVAEILRMPEHWNFGDLHLRGKQLARLVVDGVERFCSSADEVPLAKHVPGVPGLETPEARQALTGVVLPYLQRAWEDLTRKRGDLSFTHNCQPSGTMVRVSSRTSGGGMGVGGSRTQWFDKPIDDIRVGDAVVTWAPAPRRGYVRRVGRRVTAAGSRWYSGDLVEVQTARGRSSAYTQDHRCVVRMDADLTDGNHVVYVARRGDSYRVGRTTWRTSSQSNTLGIRRRAESQGADALWILAAFGSDEEAALAEALASYQFNLPTWQFRSVNESMPLDKFWSVVGDNSANASSCLQSFGRDICFPFWEYGAGWEKTLRPVVLRACNLLSGMRVCEPDEVKPGAHGGLSCNEASGAWSGIAVTRRPYQGWVYSLDVEKDHTYVADGIVTHNCYLKMWAHQNPELPGDAILIDEIQDLDPLIAFIIDQQTSSQKLWIGDPQQSIYQWRGVTNLFDREDLAPHRLPLSASFRFGPAIAEEANRILELLGTELRVEGRGCPDSQLATLQRPGTILTRTNAEAVARLMEAQVADVRAGLVGGTRQVEMLARGAQQLMAGRKADHPELAAFDTWQQLQTYVEDGEAKELAVLVKLVDAYGPDQLLGAVERAVPENQAQLVISTAHKGKGRQFDTVKIASDFPSPVSRDPETGEPRFRAEEARLAYVAVTRAQRVLDSQSLSWVDVIARKLDQVREFPAIEEVEYAEIAAQPTEQVICDPDNAERLMFRNTKYDPDLVAAQRELPGRRYFAQYCSESKVNVCRATAEAVRVAERFELSIADEARDRVAALTTGSLRREAGV